MQQSPGSDSLHLKEFYFPLWVFFFVSKSENQEWPKNTHQIKTLSLPFKIIYASKDKYLPSKVISVWHSAVESSCFLNLLNEKQEKKNKDIDA